MRTLFHEEHQTSTSSSTSVYSWHFKCSSLLLQSGSVLDLCQLTVLGACQLFFFLSGVCFHILSNFKPLYQTSPCCMEQGFSFFFLPPPWDCVDKCPVHPQELEPKGLASLETRTRKQMNSGNYNLLQKSLFVRSDLQ